MSLKGKLNSSPSHEQTMIFVLSTRWQHAFISSPGNQIYKKGGECFSGLHFGPYFHILVGFFCISGKDLQKPEDGRDLGQSLCESEIFEDITK